jgi:hypothetical protein
MSTIKKEADSHQSNTSFQAAETGSGLDRSVMLLVTGKGLLSLLVIPVIQQRTHGQAEKKNVKSNILNQRFVTINAG